MNRRLPKWLRFLFAPIRWFWRSFFPMHFVRFQYRYITGRKLNLHNPQTFTEKLQRLRLIHYPNDPLVSHCSDRVGLMDYLKEHNLSEHQVPVLGVYDRYDDIPFETLPQAFVLKCTHASGFHAIILNKQTIDHHQLRRQFNRWLKTNYGRLTVEMHYASIPPKMIVEAYVGKGSSLPLEYKLHVFHGEVKYLYVVSGRGHDLRYTHFLADWSSFPQAQFNGWQASSYPILEPKVFPRMKTIAEKLGQPFPFVRVDLYVINEKIYVSELTFTPAKGTLNLVDPSVDHLMGEWLTL
jgi:hypothetical protein